MQIEHFFDDLEVTGGFVRVETILKLSLAIPRAAIAILRRFSTNRCLVAAFLLPSRNNRAGANATFEYRGNYNKIKLSNVLNGSLQRASVIFRTVGSSRPQ